MSKVILMTGVSYVGGNDYLEDKFLPLCKKRGKKVKIIYPGKMLFKVGGTPLNKKNVLNAPRDRIDDKMSRVFEKIGEKMNKYRKTYDAVVIKTHRWFKWELFHKRAHSARHLIDLDPDIVVTFVDGAVPILKRIMPTEQFEHQNYTKEDICNWQNIEVESTQELADIMQKPFFVIPTAESPELLYSLIFEPNVTPAYVAIDITHSSPELMERVNSFVSETRKYLPFLINPYTVPLDYTEKNDVEYSHIVNMCLDWFVIQSEIVIGYYPAVIPSEGKPHEIGKAFILTKDVWVVYIPEKTNPFVEQFKTRPIFRSEEEFFNFLKNRKK